MGSKRQLVAYALGIVLLSLPLACTLQETRMNRDEIHRLMWSVDRPGR